MPMGYWQCKKCGVPFRSKYKGGERPQVDCGRCKQTMKFRGEGLAGRNNWPYGKPEWSDEIGWIPHTAPSIEEGAPDGTD